MIILTGGAGFIGSTFTMELNNLGINDILWIDNLKFTEKWKNLINLNLTDYDENDYFLHKLLNNEYQDVEAILHFGACFSKKETNASYLIENNFEFTKILSQFSIEIKLDFIYTSSAIYGNGEFGYSQENIFKLKPLNMYGY